MQSTHRTPSSSPALPTALPTSVAWLGYGGLLPFAALAGIGWWAPGTPLWGTALLAWPAVLLPMAGGAALLIVGFAAHLAQDLRLASRAALPAWYLPLRWRLTVTACVCLALGAVAAHG